MAQDSYYLSLGDALTYVAFRLVIVIISPWGELYFLYFHRDKIRHCGWTDAVWEGCARAGNERKEGRKEDLQGKRSEGRVTDIPTHCAARRLCRSGRLLGTPHSRKVVRPLAHLCLIRSVLRETGLFRPRFVSCREINEWINEWMNELNSFLIIAPWDWLSSLLRLAWSVACNCTLA